MFNLDPNASPIVVGVLVSLILASVITWTIVLLKTIQVWRMRRQNNKFRAAFWAAKDLQDAANLEGFGGPVYRVAQVGFHALNEADSVADLRHSGDRQEVLERSLRQQIQKERVTRESGLVVLASIGSTSPFIGLFGTVWGIMHALTGISKAGSASLDVVAGPIGEALLATGVGIAVAVPAVLAYNFFLRRLKTSSNNLDDFAEDLIKVLRRVSYRKVVDANGKADASSAGVVHTLKGAVA
ncbi:MotA/TolQ/ExbB proton channel family protein [Methylotenera versatilis]|uniref:MotA/TolQ/ExbB proton channel family protein n=1 Tax=Methylotenera versatilis TaxID=1055487 RepID=UPI000645F3F9|nr:MotA/TolQ/ExbB proton channel family protein [Methylotenera versatilis]